MADDTPKLYTQPVNSVVLPKRLHVFLAYHNTDHLVLNVTTRDYLELIDIFHPKLCLPLSLEKDVVIKIFELIVLPSLHRQDSFDKDSYLFSYISTGTHPYHVEPHPTKCLVLPQHLIKFLAHHDDPDVVVDGTPEEYHQMIDLFFPKSQLPHCLDKETSIQIFDILVRPFLRRLEDFDEDSGHISYLTVEVLPRFQPKVIPVQSITLPPALHGFLAFVDPKVTVVAPSTAEHMLQVIKLFHPHAKILLEACEDHTITELMPTFTFMVLPYLRNLVSLNLQDNTLTYRVVDL